MEAAVRERPAGRQQWLEERRKGIGGSDVAALLGLSPWKSPLDVYLDKIGEAPPDKETKRQRRGQAIEPLILRKFEERMGVQVARFREPLVSERHPFMRANLDGRMPNEGGQIVEAKCAWSPDGWGDDGSNEVPAYYQTQACHYFEVTGAEVCFFPVLFGMDGLDWEQIDVPAEDDGGENLVWVPKIADDADFRIFTVERDEKFVADVVEAERAFWHEHVLARVPPAPTNREDALKLWTRDNGKAVEVGADIAAQVAKLKELRAQQKALKEQDEFIVDQLAITFGEAAILKHGGADLATYKHQKRKGYTVAEAEYRVLRLK
jgi:putative phage-type endonuclease